MEEQDYMEAFGVCPPDADTQDPEVSSNPGETPESVHESETLAEETPGNASPEEGDAGAPAKAKQSRSQNAKYAAARRQAEAERDAAMQDMDARIQQARREAQEELLKEQGIENPYTQQPITNLEAYNEYKSMHREQEQQARLRDMDMTQEQYDEYVGNLPEVKQARQQLAQAQQADFKRRIEQELRDIGTLNPAIKSLEDLVQEQEYPSVKEYVDRGLNLFDAYKLAHFDDLSTRKGRQQAINRAGKAHMSATQARGEGGVSVPSDELAMFHALMPRATDDQIAKYYNKYAKE